MSRSGIRANKANLVKLRAERVRKELELKQRKSVFDDEEIALPTRVIVKHPDMKEPSKVKFGGGKKYAPGKDDTILQVDIPKKSKKKKDDIFDNEYTVDVLDLGRLPAVIPTIGIPNTLDAPTPYYLYKEKEKISLQRVPPSKKKADLHNESEISYQDVPNVTTARESLRPFDWEHVLSQKSSKFYGRSNDELAQYIKQMDPKSDIKHMKRYNMQRYIEERHKIADKIFGTDYKEYKESLKRI